MSSTSNTSPKYEVKKAWKPKNGKRKFKQSSVGTVSEELPAQLPAQLPGTSVKTSTSPRTQQPAVKYSKTRQTKHSSNKSPTRVTEEGDDSKRPVVYRYDKLMWIFGLLVISVMHSLVFGLGGLRGWNASSPYHHNESNTSVERFLPEPVTPEPGVYKRSDEQASSRWYYWKLKPSLVTVNTKVFVWACYCLHNLSTWLVLYLQQRSKIYQSKKEKTEKYTSSPDKYNLFLLLINSFFHVMQLIKTHVTYDGTAGDVSEASAQCCVIVALVVIMYIEFPERGVLLGYPTKRQQKRFMSRLMMSPVHLLRKLHGYFIYWAAIYTFWYHPMENTVGHALGFTHTWLFMLQGSLAFQAIHLNKYWQIVLESWVILHSSVVMYQAGSTVAGKELWPMFLFGFTTILVLTQLYGLPFWKNLPSWSRALPVIIYTVVVLAAFTAIKDVEGRPFTRIPEIIRIAGLYYLLLIIGWLAITVIIKLMMIIRHRRRANVKVEPEGNFNDNPKTKRKRPSKYKEVIVLVGVIFTYIINVLLSWYLEYIDIAIGLFIFTVLYCIIYLLMSVVAGSLLLNVVIPVKKLEF